MDVLSQLDEVEKRLREEKRQKREQNHKNNWCSLCQSFLPACWDQREDKWDLVDFFDFRMAHLGIGVQPVHKKCKEDAMYRIWKEENGLE